MTLNEAVDILTRNQVSARLLVDRLGIDEQVAIRLVTGRNVGGAVTDDMATEIIRFAEEARRRERNESSKAKVRTSTCRICGAQVVSYRRGRLKHYCRECRPLLATSLTLLKHAAVCGQIIIPNTRIIYRSEGYGYARPEQCVAICMDRNPVAYFDCLGAAARANWPGWRFKK